MALNQSWRLGWICDGEEQGQEQKLLSEPRAHGHIHMQGPVSSPRTVQLGLCRGAGGSVQVEGAFHIFQTEKYAKLNHQEPKREEAGQVLEELYVPLFTSSG